MNIAAIEIKAEGLNPELFSRIAEEAAKVLAESRDGNKPTQLRRFYDELCLWEQRVREEPARFNEYLPFIRMLNAKAAYARGRKHVDENFVNMLNRLLSQVQCKTTLRHSKLFFEAVMGYLKMHSQSNG